MVQAPTGFGKTLTAANLIFNALEKHKRVAFTVPRISLIDQTVERFGAEGITELGVMQGAHPLTDHSKRLQICSVQTLLRRKRPDVDLVIVDEAHLMFKGMMEWMTDPEWAHVPFIGLSATPWSRGLGKFYSKLVVAATTKDLIEEKWLSPYKAFAPSEPDLRKVHTLAGDFNQEELADVMDSTTLIGDIVETWLKRAEFRPTFAFCVNRRHAMHICEQFREAGVGAEYMDAFTEREDRAKILRNFRAGFTKVVCNVGVLTTGVDEDVRCIIDAHPTKSEMTFVQTIGRGLRVAEGKDYLLILDHAGNHIRLGPVDSIHHDHLDDGKPKKPADRVREAKEKIALKPRVCSACKAVMPPAVTQCPECGHLERAVHAKVHDGELVELGKKPAKVVYDDGEKRRFYSELLSLKGDKQHGWVAHKFKAKFGDWPPNSYRWLGPATPRLETRRWVQAQNIAWAKSVGMPARNAERIFSSETA